MDAAISIFDKGGQLLSFHPISFRYQLEKDHLVIDIAGIDHVVLMELGPDELHKLTHEALNGWTKLNRSKGKERKDRGLG